MKCWIKNGLQPMAGALCAVLLATASPFAMSADLKILTTEEPPTNYTADGKVTGITVDIVEELKKRLSNTAVVQVQPWARAYDTALAEPDVLIFTMGKTPDRVEKGFSFIGPVTTRKHMIFKKAGSAVSVNSLEDIKKQNLTVGGMRGDWRTKLLQDQGIKAEEVVTHDINIKKLVADRFPLFVLSDLELGMNAKLAGVAVEKIEPAFTIREGASYIGLSKGTAPEVVAKWQQAFTDFQKSEAPARLAKKWSAILGSNLTYTPEAGYTVK